MSQDPENKDGRGFTQIIGDKKKEGFLKKNILKEK